MQRVIRSLLRLFWVAAILQTPSSFAHEGHDHGAPPPPVSATIAPRADASTNDFELVVVARGETLTLYLDGFRDNAPVKGAEIEVDAPDGTQKAVAQGDGVFTLVAPWVAKPGSHDLAITVTASGLVDVMTATLTVPERKTIEMSPGASSFQGLPTLRDLSARLGVGDAALIAIGIGAFFLGVLLTLLVRRKPATAAFVLASLVLFAPDISKAAEASAPAKSEVAARDIAQRFPDGSLFVPKSTQRILAIRTQFTEIKGYQGAVEMPGRIIPDPNGAGYVQASVAGRLMPPPGGFPRLGTPVKAGDILAHVHPGVGAADVTTQQLQARDLDQQISLVSRRLERLKAIQNVVARSQIEDSELELAGLQARRANLERAPKHAENLIAPVSGVIAAASATAGQIAETNTVVFQIVDPEKFWVEALSYEAQAITGKATARFADTRTVALDYRGTGLAERNQAVPVQFSIAGETRGLRVGQLVTVLATTAEERTGIAVPRAAVLRGTNGQPLVFEHTNAERFVPREVRTEPLDGGHVLIVSGIQAGKRIVTQGAELLSQIR